MEPTDDARVARWIDALIERHTRDFSRPQLLKAIRALSARYVERRADLGRRSPTDSPGKRAAFAAFYAPLHFLTVRAVARGLSLAARPVERIVDLGCGTGAASAGWALTLPTPPRIEGVDRDAWAIREAAWTWSTLGCRGRARRGDLEKDVGYLFGEPAVSGRKTAESPKRYPTSFSGAVLGWAVNELDGASRGRLLSALEALGSAGAAILVLEPIARTAAPWWPEWADRLSALGGRADIWKFDLALPPRLADLDEAAGFRREGLSARSLWLTGSDPQV